MTGDQHDIVAILVKYALHEPLSEDEEGMLQEWRRRSPEHAGLPDQFRDLRWLEEQRRQMHIPPTEVMWEEIRQYIDEDGEPAPVMVLPTKRRIGLASYPVAVILFAGMIWGGMRWKQAQEDKERASQVVVPAGYKALLVLDDGSLIVLDTLKKGAIIAEGPIRIRKADSNSYIYTVRMLPTEAIRHRLTIASGGGKYRIQWPDSSYAWLKGGASLDYAVDLRSADLTLAGEAWFNVAHDPGRPVVVGLSGGALVRVLGTSFDVQSATPEGPENRVTLISGSVRVVKGVDSVLLRPGSQAVTEAQGIKTAVIDSNAILAWTRPAVQSAYFEFTDADLLRMLPEIAAWYQVEVVNPQHLSGVGITGQFSRSRPLAVLMDELKRVEGNHVKIELRKDTIFIAPLKLGE
jgi:transmembrane sensor